MILLKLLALAAVITFVYSLVGLYIDRKSVDFMSDDKPNPRK